jgi:hypothetical protein
LRPDDLPEEEPEPQPQPEPEPNPPGDPEPAEDVVPTPPDTKVAEAEQPSEIPPIEGVPAMLFWVNTYPLGSCQFAQALVADERSITIEAFGTEVPPFEAMMGEFESTIGFEPDILLRVATGEQCAAVDFLRFVKPLAEAGPRLAIDGALVAPGTRLTGNIQATAGWQTDLLLVDDRGIVHTVNATASATGPTATFATPLPAAPSGSPMFLLSISSRGGLSAARSADGQRASTVFPALFQEIQETGTEIAVGVKYVKVDG